MSNYTLLDLEQLVADKVEDEAQRLSVPRRDRCIQEAIESYSRQKPLIAVKEVTSVGGTYDSVTAWDGYILDFSSVKCIEYPVDKNPTSWIDERDYYLIRVGNTDERLYQLYAITSGNKYRVHFTCLHTCTTAVSTLPDSDVKAIANLAASIACEELAMIFAGTTDPTIMADVVNYQGRSKTYSDMAKFYKDKYNEMLGLNKGALVIKNVDSTLIPGWAPLQRPKRSY